MDTINTTDISPELTTQPQPVSCTDLPPSCGALHLSEPEPSPEPAEAAVLLDDLQALLRRFVILPQWAAESFALWILHTYAFELRDVSVYMGIESPEKRCGKTTLLTALNELVNRPIVSSNISPPAFFRIIAENRPTLLIDEADTLLWRNEELRGILNSGYTRKTAFVVRVSGETRTPADPSRYDDQDSPRPRPGLRLARFSCWCPKAIAAIGRLPETLSDRCIIIRMQRKTPGEECERLRNLDPAPFRSRCARFVQDHSHEITSARPAIPAELNDRAADVWEPLFVLADLAGGRWPALARQAAVELSASAQDTSPITSLFLSLLAIFNWDQTRQENAKIPYDSRIFSRTLVERLNAFHQRPWAESIRGKLISELWLAKTLRPYGIRPKAMWLGGACGRGYAREDFADAFRRYIPDSALQDLLKLRRPPQEPQPTPKT